MYRLGSRPHPAVHAPAHVAVRPTVDTVPRRDGAGADAPGAATEVTW